MAESGSFLHPGEIATSTYSAAEETFERTPRDNTLCQRCEAFDIQALRLDHPLYARGYKVDDVKLSADRGCRFCKTLIEGLPIASRRGESPWGPNGPQVGEYIHFRAFRANEAGGLKEAVMQWWQTGPLGITHIAATVAAEPSPGFLDPRVNLILHATADLNDPATTSGDILGKYTGKDTRSAQFMSSIRTWLNTCSEHKKCSHSLSGKDIRAAGSRSPLRAVSRLPTRCVEVIKGTGGGWRLQLRLTEEGERGVYVTLSHRWNTETHPSKTTTQNVAERMKGRGFGPMPRLFLDVFRLCSRLGIQYVWIDSLCIIQGDDGDFPAETVKMADYYQYSAFTVANPSASGPAMGLFDSTEQDNSPIPLMRLPYRDTDGQQRGHLYVYETERGLTRWYWEGVTKSELLSRGWVFQEWVLSRRIVCFTPSGLFLQCKEQYPHTQVGETVDGLTKDDDFVDFTLKPTIANDLDLSSADKIHTAWEGVVESYSGLSLTNADTDRLVALSGIAQEFSSALSPDTDTRGESANRYMDRELVSGLWRSTIVHRGLLWEQIKRGPHERIASIPTWSWASIVTRVRWPSNKHRNTVKRNGLISGP